MIRHAMPATIGFGNGGKIRRPLGVTVVGA